MGTKKRGAKKYKEYYGKPYKPRKEKVKDGKKIYSCKLCDWTKITDSILDFNEHASTEHRDLFFIDPKDSIRNDKRLRDYVNVDPIEKDRRKEYDR